MAESVKTLRRRLRSVKNTRQITRAMEMVSAAKLRRAQDILMAGRPYATKLQELLGRLASGSEPDHPLFEMRDVRRRLLVVFTADRGLAGAFNAHIVKRAETFLRSTKEETALVLVGKKAYDHFKSRHWPIESVIADFGGKSSSQKTNELARQLTDAFLSGAADEILVMYNAFVSMMVYRPTTEKLLPLDPEALLQKATDAQHHARADYLYEPDRVQVFASLLPRYVTSKLYISLAESFTAEHSARMVAMSGATRNCEDLIDALTLRMNKARQAAITTEITEIVGGAEALQG